MPGSGQQYLTTVDVTAVPGAKGINYVGTSQPRASRNPHLEEEEADLLQHLFSKIITIAMIRVQYQFKFGEPCEARLGLNYFRLLR